MTISETNHTSEPSGSLTEEHFGYIIVHPYPEGCNEYITEDGYFTDNPLLAWIFDNAQDAKLECNENEYVKYMEYTVILDDLYQGEDK